MERKRRENRSGMSGLGRNDGCWCGSGLKYKKCHLAFDEKLDKIAQEGGIVPSHDLIKTPAQIEGIKRCAVVNSGLLDYIGQNVAEGMSTEEIDRMAYEFTVSHGARPADLGYEGFPKSICTSVNDVVCHGIPDKEHILKSGDIINVDATTCLDGFYADASRMYLIGEVTPEAKQLVEVTRECLYRGIAAIRPWGKLNEIGKAIQSHAESFGYSVVREFTGHGVGLDLHEDPIVCHFETNDEMILVPGMVLTVEPMINAGGMEIYIDDEDGWTVRTEDGSLSAQWEHTVLVTESGTEIIS